MHINQLPSEKLVDENGHINSVWRDFFSRMVSNFQIHLSNDGYLFPTISNADDVITNNEKYKSLTFYDESRNKLIVNENGILKKIETTNL